jgi:hypothetical protein
VIATRRRARVRFLLGGLATVAGLVAAAVAVVASPTTASVWLLVPYVLATTTVAARHMLRAVRVLRVHSPSRGRLGPVIPSRRRALAQLRRELDRLPETRHPMER